MTARESEEWWIMVFNFGDQLVIFLVNRFSWFFFCDFFCDFCPIFSPISPASQIIVLRITTQLYIPNYDLQPLLVYNKCILHTTRYKGTSTAKDSFWHYSTHLLLREHISLLLYTQCNTLWYSVRTGGTLYNSAFWRQRKIFCLWHYAYPLTHT